MNFWSPALAAKGALRAGKRLVPAQAGGQSQQKLIP